MREEPIFVTGWVDCSPGRVAHNEQVQQAFQEANAAAPATIYVLGGLFRHGTPRDAMDRFLRTLPGRKYLVVAGSATSRWEREMRDLSMWEEVTRYVELSMWGRQFQLSPDIGPSMTFDRGLIIHADQRQEDGPHMIDVRWAAWNGPESGYGGLQPLYKMAILAEQMRAGMAAVEPADGS